MAAVRQLEVGAREARCHEARFLHRDERVVLAVEDADPALVAADRVPALRGAVIAAGAFARITEIGVADADQHRPEHVMRLGVAERRDGA